MDEYPDPDEEFELMYGDELELLNEQETSSSLPIKTRKSLNFNTPSTSKTVQENGDFNASQSFSSFEKDFSELENQPLPNESSLVQSNLTDHSNYDSNKKRTVDELFGDIDDIQDVFIDEEPIPKRHKGDKLQEDLELIEHILQLRKLAKDKHITSVNTGNLYNHRDRDRNNISYRVPKYPFIGMTSFNKERVYIRFHSEEYEKEEIERLTKECSFSGAIGDSFKQVWKNATVLINNQIDSNLDELNMINQDLVDEQINNSKQLWVDLYRPRKYLELLSDESTNRIMLKWIKLWDKAVFNRKLKMKPMKPEDHNKKKFFKMQELNTNLDEHGRPYYKVALLCGPPGLGKTTLAHMVARHAGYNIVEINASDDRSTEAFKTSLENATQMRSIIDREGRPNCLVFDEIDGAPQSSIDFLVKFINGTATTKAKKGKSQKQSILKRPIICICNDVYVPALRALRQIAFIVNFPQTSSARLAERLMEIAHKQQIKTDLGAMMALSEKSNNDVRSCLSVLHFFKAQSKPVGLSDIYRANVGQKDVQKGLFAVWQDIFYIERPMMKIALDKDNNKETMKFRMSKVLQTVSAFGDYDRVTQGIFENFPHLKLKDSSLEGISESLNWFIFSDLLSHQIYSAQNYTLMSYLQYAFVVWHFIFGTTQKQKINYPSVGYEVKQKENRQRALVSEVLRGMQPSVRAYCQRMALVLDVLPLLVKIICPPFRPVSLHLYTKHEKALMLKVVHTMIDYNLSYIQERSPDGTYAYMLEPNVEEIVIFDKATSMRRTLSYSNKQLIAREIELEKMRRFEIPKTNASIKEKSEAMKKSEIQLPNHLQKLKAKTVKAAKPVVTKDFFGRVVEKSSSIAKSAPSHKNDIWYQYKEGYSNAVRKRITISSLK